MPTTSTFTTTEAANLNTVLHGDCVEIMRTMQPGSVDFVITDPPYITRYSDRSGRHVANDDNARWLKPAFAQIHRVLKSAAFCVSFYGWNKVDLFIDAWRAAGFRIGGHLVFRKRYPSSTRFLRYQHEQAYLLVKGEPHPPAQPIPDVIEFPYTGNKLHPTQKPVTALKPLIEAFAPRKASFLTPSPVPVRHWSRQRNSAANASELRSTSATTIPPRRGRQRRRP